MNVADITLAQIKGYVKKLHNTGIDISAMGYPLDGDLDVKNITDSRHLPPELINMILRIKGREHVTLIAATPARILGLNKGQLKKGFEADIVVFDDDISINAVFSKGIQRL